MEALTTKIWELLHFGGIRCRKCLSIGVKLVTCWEPLLWTHDFKFSGDPREDFDGLSSSWLPAQDPPMDQVNPTIFLTPYFGGPKWIEGFIWGYPTVGAEINPLISPLRSSVFLIKSSPLKMLCIRDIWVVSIWFYALFGWWTQTKICWSYSNVYHFRFLSPAHPSRDSPCKHGSQTNMLLFCRRLPKVMSWFLRTHIPALPRSITHICCRILNADVGLFVPCSIAIALLFHTWCVYTYTYYQYIHIYTYAYD